VSKDDLIAAVWDRRIVSDSALATRINAVRRAICDSGDEQRLIKTLPQKGIRFVGEVHEEQGLSEIAASIAADPSAPAPSLPDRPSLAVLPFQNMSGDPEQEYFADGMVDDIITALSRFKSLFVIARNSSFSYKGKSPDIRQVGRELGVRYVLEGSVRKASRRLRISGQLIDASTGAHLWVDRFDGALEDVFELQDQMTERVVTAIAPRLERTEIDRSRRKTAGNLGAYDCYLRSLACLQQITKQSLEQAELLLRQAIQLDPELAPAYGLLLQCLATRRGAGLAPNPNEAEIARLVRMGPTGGPGRCRRSQQYKLGRRLPPARPSSGAVAG